jgi:hypothetical protein
MFLLLHFCFTSLFSSTYAHFQAPIGTYRILYWAQQVCISSAPCIDRRLSWEFGNEVSSESQEACCSYRAESFKLFPYRFFTICSRSLRLYFQVSLFRTRGKLFIRPSFVRSWQEVSVAFAFVSDVVAESQGSFWWYCWGCCWEAWKSFFVVFYWLLLLKWIYLQAGWRGICCQFSINKSDQNVWVMLIGFKKKLLWGSEEVYRCCLSLFYLSHNHSCIRALVTQVWTSACVQHCFHRRWESSAYHFP